MKFMVSRTSSWGDPKVDGATKEPCIRVDVRNARSPQEIPAYRNVDPGWWYAEGRNHRTENGMICRDFDDEEWFIELETLEDRVKFREEHGSLVIRRPLNNNRDFLEIEVYDDYRE